MLSTAAYFILDDTREGDRYPAAYVSTAEVDGVMRASVETNYCGGALEVGENQVVGSDPGPIKVHAPVGVVVLQRATLTTRDIPEVQIALAGYAPEALEAVNACESDEDLQKLILGMCTA